MRREAGIPVVLWICAAAWIHTAVGGGGFVAADLHDGNAFVTDFGAAVRERVRQGETVVALDIGDGVPTESEEAPKPDEPPLDPSAPPQVIPIAKAELPKPEAAKLPEPPKPPKPIVLPKVAIKPEESPKVDPLKLPPPKDVKQKPDEPKVAKKDPPAPTPPEPEVPKDQRIAVRQHVVKDQDDNAAAKLLAEDANKVEQETAATQTSHDQDNAHPTPGTSAAGPKDTVGNAEKTRVADSDDHAGEKNRAPGESGTQFSLQPMKPQELAPAKQAVVGPKAAAPPAAGGDGRTASSGAPPPPAGVAAKQPAREPGAPEIAPGATGGWSFSILKPGAPPNAIAQAFGSVAPPSSKPPSAFMGLGGSPGPGRVNLNLTHEGMVAAVGAQELQRQRVADGERRLSQHRGSFQSSSLERWKPAIENYVSSVKPGNQTALNTARSPFATYLVGMHVRIHPIFADSFLDTLSNLPPEHPLSNRKMYTRLEIVLNREGQVQRMGIVKPAGMTMFDVAALDSVQRASPFGPVPTAIVSRDGNVYLHWEFHRDEAMACSTMNARPFMLTTPSPTAPVEPAAPGGPPAPEGTPDGAAPPTAPAAPGAVDVRHGRP